MFTHYPLHFKIQMDVSWAVMAKKKHVNVNGNIGLLYMKNSCIVLQAWNISLKTLFIMMTNKFSILVLLTLIFLTGQWVAINQGHLRLCAVTACCMLSVLHLFILRPHCPLCAPLTPRLWSSRHQAPGERLQQDRQRRERRLRLLALAGVSAGL